MQWHLKIFIRGVFALFLPAGLLAQSNICQPPTPSVPNEARAELARIQAEERSRQELARANWTASIFPLKNVVSADSLRVLCIFGIEVAPQPAQRLVAIRAPKELIPAVEEALKRLDVPLPAAKNVELTGYVLVVSEESDPTLMPVPAVLDAVAAQLKSILPRGNLYLADTVVTRGIVGNSINVNGNTNLSAFLSMREGTPPVIRLEGFDGYMINARFRTAVDIPVGSQVVVGKATTTPQGTSKSKAVVLVMSAKLLD